MILGLSLVNYGLRYMRWQGYLVRRENRVPPDASLAYYLGGFAFTVTLGKAGEAVRSLFLNRHGVSYVHSLAPCSRSIDELGPLDHEDRRGLYLHTKLAVNPDRLCHGVLNCCTVVREPGSLRQEKDDQRPIDEKVSGF